MKKLSKVRLINWYGFTNELIELDGITLITGENGAGKSTIMDAISMLVTYDTKHFNSAGNSKNERNLMGYIRHQTGNEGRMYERNGQVVSYVALEIYDDKEDTAFVTGGRFESKSIEAGVTAEWFILDCALADLAFVNVAGKPTTSAEFINGCPIYIRHKEGNKIFERKIEDIRQKSRRRLGNLDERIYKIIPKALAFKDVDNTNRFIRDYMLLEQPTGIGTLRDTLQTRRQLEIEVKNTKTKVAAMKDILAAAETYNQLISEYNVARLMEQYAKREALRLELDNLKREHESNERILVANVRELDRLKAEKQAKHKELVDVSVSIRQNDVTAEIERLDKEIESQEAELTRLETEFDQLTQTVDNLVTAINRLRDYCPDIELFDLQKLNYLTVSNIPVSSKAQGLSELEAWYRDTLKICEDQLAEYEKDVAANQKKKLDLETDIQNLSKNKIKYPDNTERLLNAIRNKFKSHGVNAEPQVVSALLEITDSEWQDAIEGTMGIKRFHVLVPPEHFDLAVQAYRDVRQFIKNVRLVDTQKLELNRSVPAQSLATKIVSDNPYAKAYADETLGHIYCCDTKEEMQQYKSGVTKACENYYQRSFGQIDKDYYKQPFFGAGAAQKQWAQKRLELKVVEEELSSLTPVRNRYQQVVNALHAGAVDKMGEQIEIPNTLPGLKYAIQSKRERRQQLLGNDAVQALQHQFYNVQAEHQYLESACADVAREIGDFEGKIQRARSDMEHKRAEYNEQKVECEKADNEFDAVVGQATRQFEEARKSKSMKTVMGTAQKDMLRLTEEYTAQRDKLLSLQRAYNQKFADELPESEDVSQYQAHYTMLSGTALIQMEDELVQSTIKCREVFRESFLWKLKENIEKAKKEIAQLNRTLQTIKFGEDVYEIVAKPNPMELDWYNMIINCNNQPISGDQISLTGIVMENEYEKEMNALFDMLLDAGEEGERNMQKYSDYRTYMTYDIKIHKGDEYQWLSETHGTKSGGECQIPYYVIICAAFAQVYNTSNNSIRLALFDEAFSNMDAAKRELMLALFRQHGLQSLIVSPTLLGPNFDTMLYVNKIDKSHMAYVDKYGKNEIKAMISYIEEHGALDGFVKE